MLIALLALPSLTGCTGEASKSVDVPDLLTDVGVDAASQIVKIGALNDESGPAAAIGKPYAMGKRLLADRINAGNSGLLPIGWKVELVERDHAYNAQKAIQAYEDVREEVLFIGTSFGTPNTLPLRPKLEDDNLVAFPASLSSEMAKHPHTPPLGASYAAEARRAMDFMVDQAGGRDGVKAGIVFQQDDYGKDGLDGLTTAAKQYGVELVAEISVAPGDKDVAAVITELKSKGATHVLLAILPTTTGPVLGTALQLEYTPVWVGATPAWIDAFYNPELLPPAVFASYHQANSLPYWGEDVPGMSDFLKAHEAHGTDVPRDFYVLLSYVQGLAQIEAANRAIDSGDITRMGYFKALTSLRAFDGGGMIRPIDLSSKPYEVSDEVRILKPDLENRSWTVAMPYGTPGVPPRERPGQEAPGDEANAAYPPGEGGGE